MNGLRRLLLSSSMATALALSAALSSGTGAGAYGNTSQFQATFSLNCDNASFFLCANPPNGVGLGGFWGWYEFGASADGGLTGTDGDATLTGCEHFGLGIPALGAQHFNLMISAWHVGAATSPFSPVFLTGSDFYVDSGSVTAVGRSGSVTLPVPGPPGTPGNGFAGDTGIPATPGQYRITSLFGVPFPAGVFGQITVAAISTKL